MDVNAKWGNADINDWILSLLKLQQGEALLDVGCGYGLPTLLAAKAVEPSGQVVGTDLQLEFVLTAHQSGRKIQGLTFMVHSATTPFPFRDETFDAILCNFAIYHFSAMDGFLREVHRMLTPNGRFLVTGPDPENNEFLYQVQIAAGGKITAHMARDTFKSMMQEHLATQYSYQYHVFRNMITFPSIDDFARYYSDSALFLLNTPTEERVRQLGKVRQVLGKAPRLQNEKVVGGYLAWKL
jgi:ubiquinone/menaquinone biosynthesis C-methylase UbiE